MPNRVLQKVSEPPIAVPWSSVIQIALWLAVGLPWSPQLPCQTNMWPRKQSAPFSEFGRSVTGWGRFRAALPVWRLTDNTDSMSGQRRRRTNSPPRGATHHHRRPAMTTSKWQRDFKSSQGRHCQSSPVISALARSSAGCEAALSTIGWTTRARTCWWCVWMTIPSWRWNIWPSSCSSQGAGGAGDDVATLGGSRRRILLGGILIAIQSVTGDQVAAQYRHWNTFLPECATKSDIWPVSDRISDRSFVTSHFFALSVFWRVSTLMSCRPFYQMLYNIGVVHTE